MLAKAHLLLYRGAMCKPFREYLNLVREYTREIITFVGIGLMCFVYTDFRRLAEEQSATTAHTVEVLRSMDIRLQNLEHSAHFTPSSLSHENRHH